MMHSPQNQCPQFACAAMHTPPRQIGQLVPESGRRSGLPLAAAPAAGSGAGEGEGAAAR